MATPSRQNFKRKVAAQESIDNTPGYVDLLTWNETGFVENIAKMNALIRAGIQKP
jgi:hypothetical protein